MLWFVLPRLPALDIHGYLDLRERFERRLNRDFDNSAKDDRTDMLTRIRAGAKLAYGKTWRGQIEMQLADDEIASPSAHKGAENWDLSIGYVETDLAGATVAVGRQKINYGQQRLIGAVEWTNVSRSFDAVRLRSKEWDGFAGKIGMQSPYPPHARLVAALHLSKIYGDSLYVFKHDSGVDIHTIDHSVALRAGSVLLDAEGALQIGRVGGLDQRAWAIHLGAAAALKGRMKPFAIFDSASGGKSGSENRTFDNLYPTNHGKFGIADMAGWKNIDHFALGLDYAVMKHVDTPRGLAPSRPA